MSDLHEKMIRCYHGPVRREHFTIKYSSKARIQDNMPHPVLKNTNLTFKYLLYNHSTLPPHTEDFFTVDRDITELDLEGDVRGK